MKVSIFPGGSTTLHKARMQTVLDTINKLDGQSSFFYAGTYTGLPKTAFKFEDKTQHSAAYALMFKVDGSVDGVNGVPLEEDNHTFVCTVITGDAALDRFEKGEAYRGIVWNANYKNASEADKKAGTTMDVATRIMVNTFVAEDTKATLYHCYWTNEDDSQADALLSVSFKGPVRVILGYVNP